VSKSDRQSMVEAYRELFGKGQVLVLSRYEGLTVKAMTDLRARVRAAGGSVKVVKNTLFELAMRGTEHEGLGSYLKGPLAVAFTEGDTAPVLRAVVDFAKTNEKIVFQAVSLGGKVFDGAQTVALSKLPGLPELRAQLLSVLTAVPRKFVTLLGQSQRNFLGVLNARKDQLDNAA